jgi:phosphoenolpyruvate carboxykinase (ATP)
VLYDGDAFDRSPCPQWEPKYRIKVRVICARAYHALFMRNSKQCSFPHHEASTYAQHLFLVLIRPTAEELKDFVPDFTIYNAGGFPANRFTAGMTSTTSVEVNFKRKEMVILGTDYAGEMKKGIFSVMVSDSRLCE